MKKWIYLTSSVVSVLTIFGLAIAIQRDLATIGSMLVFFLLLAVCMVGIFWSSFDQVDEYDSLVKKLDELNQLQSIIRDAKESLSELSRYLRPYAHEVMASVDTRSVLINSSDVVMVNGYIVAGITAVLETVEIIVPKYATSRVAVLESIKDLVEHINFLYEVLGANQEVSQDTHNRVEHEIIAAFDRLFDLARLGFLNPRDYTVGYSVSVSVLCRTVWTETTDKALKRYLTKSRYWKIKKDPALSKWYDFVDEIRTPRPDGEGDEDTTFPAEA